MSMTRSSIGIAVRTVAASFSKSKREEALVRSHMTRKVDGAQITDCSLVLGRDLCDLRAKVRQVNYIACLAGLITLEIRCVFERHPSIASFSQGVHHTRVKITRLDLPVIELVRLCRLVRCSESIAIQIWEFRNVFRIEERPHAVRFNPLHEKIRNPVAQD